jgi:hypothetical protein
MASGLELSKDWVTGFVSGVLAVDQSNWKLRREGGSLHIKQTRLPDGRARVKVISSFEIPPPLQDQIGKAFNDIRHNVDGVEFERLLPDADGVIRYTDE